MGVIEDVKALRVGPDEVLILHLPDWWQDDRDDDVAALTMLRDALDEVLPGRTLIIIGEAEFAVAKREP